MRLFLKLTVVIVLLPLAIALIAILVEFTHNLHHGYLRTFLVTFEIASAAIAVVWGLAAIGEHSL